MPNPSTIPAPSTSTSTPGATASPSPTAYPFVTKTPEPSPTPITYTIQSNDTIISIAKELDLTPEAILMANPGINPSALTIGSDIFLPSEQNTATEFFVKPAALDLRQPICFEEFGLLRCVAVVSNKTEAVIENISVDMFLVGVDGQELDKLSVPIILNALYPGEVQPAIVTFDLPQSYNSVQAVLASAFPVEEPGFSRGGANVSSSVSISWDGRSAAVTGRLSPVEGLNVWVAAIGFDKAGNLCAVRRWEWNAAAPPPSDQFILDLVSFGAPIDRVIITLETWQN